MRGLCTAGCGAAVVVSVLAVTPATQAQSASANVTIFRVGGLPTLNFPGVGSDSFKFASGSQIHGSGSATGTASAGQGRITAFAATGDFGGTPAGIGSMATNSSASLTDSFTVNADTTLPLKLEFGVRASGNVDTVRTGNGGTSSASVEWSISVSGGGTSSSASGSISQSYIPRVVNGVLVHELVRTETGLGFTEFALVTDLGSGIVGQTYSLSMSALARSGYNKGPQGSTTSGTADFGNTLRWMGLRSVTFADGTPYTGALTITSASGFDYTTPSPGAAGLLMAAAGLMGSRRRR